MSSVLPQIIDPEISENIELILSETDDSNNDEEPVEVKEPIPEIEHRPKIDQEVIFKTPQIKKVAKKKRVMSEEKLEQLAQARQKAREKAKLNKESRDKEVNEILSHKKDEYVKKKVEKAVKRQEKYIDEEQVIVNNGISHEDIQNIVSQSISKYDENRKIRKNEKKKKESEDQQHQIINNTIRKATNQLPALTSGDPGYFNNCFG